MKNPVYMNRAELVIDLERLRAWIIDIGKRTPHKWLKEDAKRVVENNYESMF